MEDNAKKYYRIFIYGFDSMHKLTGSKFIMSEDFSAKELKGWISWFKIRGTKRIIAVDQSADLKHAYKDFLREYNDFTRRIEFEDYVATIGFELVI